MAPKGPRRAFLRIAIDVERHVKNSSMGRPAPVAKPPPLLSRRATGVTRRGTRQNRGCVRPVRAAGPRQPAKLAVLGSGATLVRQTRRELASPRRRAFGNAKSGSDRTAFHGRFRSD